MLIESVLILALLTLFLPRLWNYRRYWFANIYYTKITLFVYYESPIGYWHGWHLHVISHHISFLTLIAVFWMTYVYE